MEVVSAVLEKIGKQKNGGGIVGFRRDFMGFNSDLMRFNEDLLGANKIGSLELNALMKGNSL